MTEKKCNETQRRHTFIKYIVTTVLAFLILVSIAGAAPFAYVTSIGGTVSVIDTSKDTITDTVEVEGALFEIVSSPDAKKIYVAVENGLSVINTTTNTVTGTVLLRGSPRGIAVSPDGKKVYVTNGGSDTVSVIDSATNKVTANVSIGGSPYEVVASPDGKKVYVTNLSNTVSVIDTATNKVTAKVDVKRSSHEIAVSPDGKKVYVTNDHNVSVINTSTNTVIAMVKVTGTEGTSDEIAVNPDGKKIYVTTGCNGALFVIDTATNTIIDIVGGWREPREIGVTSDGKKLYVADSGTHEVSVIDTSTNNVITSIYVAGAWGVAVTPLPIVLPVANFSSNVTSGYAPLYVQFTDKSTNATAWKWNFGDGTNSTVKNPIHKYSTKGNYTVSLTAINTNGSNTTTKTNYIKVLAVVKPVANFTSNVTSGYAPLNVAFTDKSINNPTSWKWNFGDGTNSTVKNPIHKYSSKGNYTVSLTVTNAAGSYTTTKTNCIKVLAIVKPVANFTSNVTSGYAPLTVAFTDKSTNNPTSWKWIFGDGTNSTSKNPTHKYLVKGNYTVTLTANNSAGSNTTTKTNYIKVVK